MILPSITLSLIPEARGAPFVLWDTLEAGIRRAAAHGYPAVELFARSAADVPVNRLKAVLAETGLKVSAFGTGAGFMLERLHLCHPDASVRQRARAYVQGFIELAAGFGAWPILGLMRGLVEKGDTADEARRRMEEALVDLDAAAARVGGRLLLEPINRYETPLINRLDEGVALIEKLGLGHTRLLADTFHMNIEEASIEEALRTSARQVGHLHWADSNRRPPGCGHVDFGVMARALQEVGYEGYVAFECLPHPSPGEAADRALKTFRRYL